MARSTRAIGFAGEKYYRCIRRYCYKRIPMGLIYEITQKVVTTRIMTRYSLYYILLSDPRKLFPDSFLSQVSSYAFPWIHSFTSYQSIVVAQPDFMNINLYELSVSCKTTKCYRRKMLHLSIIICPDYY